MERQLQKYFILSILYIHVDKYLNMDIQDEQDGKASAKYFYTFTGHNFSLRHEDTKSRKKQK